MAEIKSAIREARDQLFLDRADGEFLSAVTSNIGLDRPLFGFASDDVWRAIVRRIALDYKQVLPVFHDLLSVIFGPQVSMSTVLLEDASIGDETIRLADNGLALPQRGTVILDAGLATEETVEYDFRDPRTGEVELEVALTQDHSALITSGSGFLAAPAAAGAGNVVVEDALQFPDPSSVGNYPLLIDAGVTGTRSGVGDSFTVAAGIVTFVDAAGLLTADLVGKFIRIVGATSTANNGLFKITGYVGATSITWNNASGVTEAFTGTWTVLDLDVEETVLCVGKSGNTLALAASLVNDHAGPTVTPMTTALTAVAPGATLIFGADVNEFPESGLLQVQEDGGTPSQFVRYEDKSNDDLSFSLKAPLAGSHSTSMITLAKDGATVQLAQAKVSGVAWDVVQTQPNLLRIILPEDLERNRLLDVSYHHDSGGTPSTTVATASGVGDTVLEVADASSFPSAGIIRIDAGGTPEDISYYRIDRLSAVLWTSDASVAPPATAKTVPIGALELFVSDVTPFVAGAALGVKTAVIDPSGTPETVTIDSIDEARNMLVLASATTVAHNTVDNVFDTIQVGNQLTGNASRGPNSLHLTRALTAAHAAAQTVDIYRVYHTGQLEDGQIYTANPHRYQGPYAWDPTERVPRVSDTGGNPIETTLAENVAGPTYLVVGQRAGRTALEVKDASQFVSPTYQRVQIGRGLGGRETRPIRDIVLQKDMIPLVIAFGTDAAGHVWQVDADAGPAYVDETTDFNSATDNDVDIFPAVNAVGDWFAVGYARPFSQMHMDNANGVAGVGGVVVWEYWDGTTWSALSGVNDATSGFTAAVSDGQVVDWTVPTNWAATSINGSASLYFIRARITTIYTTNPVYDQGFVVPVVLPGDLVLEVSASGLPDAHGYRLFFDDNVSGIGEEVALVRSVSGTTVTLEASLANMHVGGDNVFLLADVIKVDAMDYDHEGVIPVAQATRVIPGLFLRQTWLGGIFPTNLETERIALVEEVREYIDVADASRFPSSGGIALVNTGRSYIEYESRLDDKQVAVAPGTASFTVSGANVVLADAGAFIAADAGRLIKVKGATTPGNDGTFPILAVVPGVSVTYWNPMGFTEPFDTVGPDITTYEVSGMAVGAASCQVEDGSGFPTANFWVVVGRGTRIEEILEVASRAGNVLTFAAGTSGDPVHLHADGEWIEYLPGETEQISYETIETGGANERLVFNEELGYYFAYPHFSGEGVNFSTQQAIPGTDGNDYPFYLPSSWEDRLQFIFDLARAAGVQVVVSSDR